MPDSIQDDAAQPLIAALPRPTPLRPLLGMTVMLVEDSRYASDALRMMCQRSGARLRRADCLRSARRHLGLYRPSVAIVDMGLPDGRGEELIAELHAARPRVAAILGFSGDPGTEDAARNAGADGFLAKPLPSLAQFQSAVIAALPEEMRTLGPRPVQDEMLQPDPLALRDDMVLAARLLSQGPAKIGYAMQFLHGVARASGDRALAKETGELKQSLESALPSPEHLARLRSLVQARLEYRAAI